MQHATRRDPRTLRKHDSNNTSPRSITSSTTSQMTSPIQIHTQPNRTATDAASSSQRRYRSSPTSRPTSEMSLVELTLEDAKRKGNARSPHPARQQEKKRRRKDETNSDDDPMVDVDSPSSSSSVTSSLVTPPITPSSISSSSSSGGHSVSLGMAQFSDYPPSSSLNSKRQKSSSAALREIQRLTYSYLLPSIVQQMPEIKFELDASIDHTDTTAPTHVTVCPRKRRAGGISHLLSTTFVDEEFQIITFPLHNLNLGGVSVRGTSSTLTTSKSAVPSVGITPSQRNISDLMKLFKESFSNVSAVSLHGYGAIVLIDQERQSKRSSLRGHQTEHATNQPYETLACACVFDVQQYMLNGEAQYVLCISYFATTEQFAGRGFGKLLVAHLKTIAASVSDVTGKASTLLVMSLGHTIKFWCSKSLGFVQGTSEAELLGTLNLVDTTLCTQSIGTGIHSNLCIKRNRVVDEVRHKCELPVESLHIFPREQQEIVDPQLNLQKVVEEEESSSDESSTRSSSPPVKSVKTPSKPAPSRPSNQQKFQDLIEEVNSTHHSVIVPFDPPPQLVHTRTNQFRSGEELVAVIKTRKPHARSVYRLERVKLVSKAIEASQPSWNVRILEHDHDDDDTVDYSEEVSQLKTAVVSMPYLYKQSTPEKTTDE